MMPDIENLAVAYSLCSCAASCSRQCTICQSPTWFQSPCVRTLFEDIKPLSPAEAIANATYLAASAALRAAIPAQPNPQNRPSAEKVEEVIDWIEENCIALLPWQAELLRTMLLGRQ